MIIKKYGLELSRLKKDDIEMVRRFRNEAYIRDFMVYRETITPAQQERWFDSVNNVHNYYFVIHHEQQPIGLINGKDINFEKGESEGGLFIWDKAYWGTFYPVMASVIMTDLSFILNDFNRNFARILLSNDRSVYYNKVLGYKELHKDPDGTSWCELTKGDYLNNVAKVRKGIGNITGDHEPLSEDDLFFHDDTDEDIRVLYTDLPDHIRDYVDRRIAATR